LRSDSRRDRIVLDLMPDTLPFGRCLRIRCARCRLRVSAIIARPHGSDAGDKRDSGNPTYER